MDDRAMAVIEEVKAVVAQWNKRYADHGVNESDLEMLQSAFLPESVIQDL